MPPALRKLFLAVLAIVAVVPGGASAEQRNGSTRAVPLQRPPIIVAPRRGIGGYSMTLSDVWGPAKMPPAPKDFGPHFDFPPQPLEGGISHAPYSD
jgi:hypothetical protein